MPAHWHLVPREVAQGVRDVLASLPHVTRDLLDVFVLDIFNLTE